RARLVAETVLEKSGKEPIRRIQQSPSRRRGRPFSRPEILIHNQFLSSRRQDLERFEKLNDRILLVGWERLESASRIESFPRMRRYRLAKCCEEAMMKERWFIGCTPEPLGKKATIAFLELLGPGRLIHVDCFSLAWFADIVKLEIGVRFDPNSSRRIWPQTRRR